MNTQSNAMSEQFPAQSAATSPLSPTRPLYWSIRRELWENRAVYVAPLAVAAVFLFGFLISLARLPHQMRALSSLDPEQQRQSIAIPYDIADGLMMLTGILVSVFYCLDALHGERRDRSILFWKSLPVSDLTIVLSKASIPFMILPLLTFVIAVALQGIILLMSSAVLLGSGQSAAALWTQISFLQMSLLLLYHLLTAHTLWPAPVYCWLLLVSGWARRAPFLWAALPVVAVGGVEMIAFRTSHFATLVGSRLIGATPAVASMPPNSFPTDTMTHIAPGQFLTTPGLWIGLAVGAAFLAAAVRLRRYRGPI
ncbi:MAG: ABC transporter permease [Candidatus Sulfotelmatobacter sp.]